MRAPPLLFLIAPALALACSAPAQDTGPRPAPTPAAPEPAAQPSASAEPLPVLPELRETSNAFMEALLAGTLIEQSGCLRVSPDGTQPGHLLIWQPGYTARRTDARLEIVDGAGGVVARVGEPLRIGGGEVTLTDSLRAQLKAPIDPACVGPYWLMGQLQSP